MKYTQGKVGRIFIVKFEHEDDLIEQIKSLAIKEKIHCATITLFGALAKGEMVCGPKRLEVPDQGQWERFDDGREVLGVGTILKTDDHVTPHIHMSFGREKEVLQRG